MDTIENDKKSIADDDPDDGGLWAELDAIFAAEQERLGGWTNGWWWP